MGKVSYYTTSTSDYLSNLMDIFFNQNSELAYWQEGKHFPPADVATNETNDFLEIVLSVPKFTKSDIQISVEGEYLIIRGERKEDARKIKYLVKALKELSFTKCYKIDSTHFDMTDISKIGCELKDGCLTLVIPKNENKNKKLIEIK